MAARDWKRRANAKDDEGRLEAELVTSKSGWYHELFNNVAKGPCPCHLS